MSAAGRAFQYAPVSGAKSVHRGRARLRLLVGFWTRSAVDHEMLLAGVYAEGRGSCPLLPIRCTHRVCMRSCSNKACRVFCPYLLI